MFWKTQDRAIDNLLGAQRARQNAPARICREFDPDLANAYIEHSLSLTETARYELHLSECAPCRKDIVALARMAEADAGVFRPEARALSIAGQSETSVRRWFGALSVPQWAMVATAVLVIVISLPIILSRRNSQPNQIAAVTGGETAQDSPASLVASAQKQTEASNASVSSPTQLEQKSGGNAEPKVEKDQEREEGSALASAKRPAGEPISGGAISDSVAPAPPPTETARPKTDSQPAADQAAAKATEPAQPAAAPATQETEKKLAQISPEEARRIPEAKDSAQVTPLASSRVDGEDGSKKEATITDKDNIAPPPGPKESAPDSRAGREMTRGPGSAARFRASRGELSRGTAERKVGGRKFWLRDDVWTDKDYKPDKEMPFITVIRDTDVYRELLSKHSGMKPFLTGFAENARVIFIYKGAVYMLIPQ
jgi:putative zinc finger protein